MVGSPTSFVASDLHLQQNRFTVSSYCASSLMPHQHFSDVPRDNTFKLVDFSRCDEAGVLLIFEIEIGV